MGGAVRIGYESPRHRPAAPPLDGVIYTAREVRSGAVQPGPPEARGN